MRLNSHHRSATSSPQKPATGLAPGKNPLEVELRLLKRVPEDYRLHAHHWLILHGRYTCKARKPECPRCVVNDLCLFKAKTTAL